MSLSSFGCVVTLLIRFDQTDVQKWASIFSLNTWLSILAVVSRASLASAISGCISQAKWGWFSSRVENLIAFDRFDDASKGPWGCLRLLPTIARRPHWIILGVMATIVLTPYGAFLQAALTFDTAFTVTTPHNYTKTGNEVHGAYLGRATNLRTAVGIGNVVSLLVPTATTGSTPKSAPASGISDTLGGISEENAEADYQQSVASSNIVNTKRSTIQLNTPNSTESDDDYNPDLAMEASVWNGLSTFTTRQNLSPAFNCPVGDCTWNRFISLAVCSKCNDISTDLSKSAGKTQVGERSDDWHWVNEPPNNITNQGVRVSPDVGEYDYTQYEIPSLGLSLSNYNGPNLCTGQTLCPDTYLTGRAQTNPGRTLTFQNYQTLLFSLATISVNVSWLENTTVWEDTKVTASECALYYCINAYDSNVKMGVLDETIVASWADRVPGSYQDAKSPEFQTLDKSNNHTLDYPFGKFKLSQLELRIPINDSRYPASRRSIPPFNISYGDVGTTIRFLKSFANTTEADPLLVFPLRGSPSRSPLIRALGSLLLARRSMPDAFEAAALSMTKWMRDRELSHSPVTGTVTRSSVIFRAQWTFLACPAATLLAGSVFVVMSIWDSKRKRLPAWKGSSLVTLAFGLGEGDRDEVREAVAGGNGYAIARSRKARLDGEKDSGFVLRLHDGHKGAVA
ncbi:hypothetical protein B0T16DRAFT_457127 [Cercophora newfieldiana]|uniref:Uncharacterized protein n=1 Tax=Cercophora newfieldiana TaxID=92897 RepID=A0AA40CSL4_9PEZI|nr:hypothetical protein B0T16DRAFT_457127 [Cercophora newfieldiana]